MLCAILAIAFVVESHASVDPANLVHQLGSNRYSQRVSAESELVSLGRGALPALRAARESKDAEIRTRSLELLAKIENSLLLQATPIEVGLGEVTLDQAIVAINRQAGPSLSLALDEGAVLGSRRISWQSKEPVSFWNAVDSLCQQGGLHLSLENLPTKGTIESLILLREGGVSTPGPVSDKGPFRVRLSSVHYQSEIQLAEGRPTLSPSGPQAELSQVAAAPAAPYRREFFFQLVVSAEPRLSINRNGAIKLLEAVDDRGQSLIGSSIPGSFQHTSGYFGLSPSSLIRFRVDLNYPSTAGRLIRTLRGTIPVLVTTRKPEPLVLPLSEPKGQSHRIGDVALTLVDYRPGFDNQPATIQLAVRNFGEPNQPVDTGPGQPLGYRPDSPQQQIELLDSRGNTLSWFPSSTIYNGEETRMTMTVASRGPSVGVPATIRYHGILCASTEVAFEFHDIPMP